VQQGPEAAGDIADEGVWEENARVSINFCRSGRAQRIAERVASLSEFPAFSRILDLGAGPGVIGIAVATAHPTLTCDLYDRRAVCKVADEVIAEYGMADRVRSVAGDYMNDPIGDSYDLVMANYTLNFYRNRLDEIMKKVHLALRPGGVFLVTSDGLTDEKTAPPGTVFSWLSMALQGIDLSFKRGEISEAMLRAGFVSTQSEILSDIAVEPHGPVEMIVGRKAEGQER
jgi:ubiquinone/menaquinone biosynthesis C-methylase UbiE